MNKIPRGIFKNVFTNVCRRGIHRSTILRTPGAYEGEGKTTIHILNKEAELGLMINGYSQVGFRLNNDMTILGPMVIFSRSVLSWNVGELSDVTEEAFCLFSVVEPKLDIIVFGVGDKVENFNFYKRILPFSRKFKIPFEILPTDQACATFNFLNSEGRYVAGAMIPPQTIKPTEDDELHSKLRYQNLYEKE